MAHTRDELIREVTKDYLDTISPPNLPTPAEVQQEILDRISNAFQQENVLRQKGEKWRIPQRLLPEQAAMAILKLYTLARICFTDSMDADNNCDLLGVYQYEGPEKGIYVTEEDTIRKLIRKFLFSASKDEINETIRFLMDDAPKKKRCSERNLVAVDNGIFDYDTKRLLPFDPKWVFIAKSHVKYNAHASNVTIHNPDDGTDWDVESWMKELFDDPALTNLIWEIIGAVIRPLNSWNKSIWFVSTEGNNGKGTLCRLMRNLCGPKTHTSIPLEDFGKDFALESLIHATAIITDENNVGILVDKVANAKSVITGDVIQINRKFKAIITFQFKGLMIQCLNELPRFKDKTESFYRRQLIVPFSKSYTGIERKYIKDDYLNRLEVLEYVLYRVLNMDYYSFSDPQACKDALNSYKQYNDPVREFVNEMLPQCVWDLLPFGFLYDLYKSWYASVSPSGQILGRNSFITSLKTIIGNNNPEWAVVDNKRTGMAMSKPEYLINDYNLRDWMNPVYINTNKLEAKCTPLAKEKYSGVMRKIQKD